MDNSTYTIREARATEFEAIGQLMVDVYSQLEGFPTPQDQPEYYERLKNIGTFIQKPKVKLLAAMASTGEIGGAVVYFGEMVNYGSGGIATQEENTAAFRLLAVAKSARGQSLGKRLSLACIELAREQGLGQMIIHTTHAMQPAWKMYEKMGFHRSEDLDFLMQGFPVVGFRLVL
ncbi:MAG: GNAT family N-acetyltransferase [Roseivirga sp.]|nr:GNAT family N-acetyltransferase [Roseivirga sp.]